MPYPLVAPVIALMILTVSPAAGATSSVARNADFARIHGIGGSQSSTTMVKDGSGRCFFSMDTG